MGSNLKSMATIAKERLRRGMYSNAEKTKAKNTMNLNSYFIKNINSLKKLSGKAEFKTISSEIDDSFILKATQILNSNTDVYNPIGLLVDKEVYNNLNNVEKQFYVLKIVDKFNKVKQDYINNQIVKIG